MGVHVIKLPDVGEGVAEAEFVELHIKPGDEVEPDQNLADVMTDKATVEIPSPRKGKVLWIGPAVGEIVAVGSEIIKLEVEGAGNTKEDSTSAAATAPAEEKAPVAEESPAPEPKAAPAPTPKAEPAPVQAQPAAARLVDLPRARDVNDKPLASPAVRARARAQGVDLQFVYGTGPAGRITHEDLDSYISGQSPAKVSGGSGATFAPDTSVEEVKVIGLRRKIAEKMQESKRRIPHITYVEEVDVTALEDLRAHMNAGRGDRPKLTVLPYLMRAMVLTLRKFPHINARFDDDAGVVHRYGGAHIGIATQTDNGLIVPVIRHAEANDVWQNAAEVLRLSSAARDGSAKREELSGSTITITSLGPMGGLVTTPVINHPEVAIVGVNKIQTLPRYDANGHVVPRKLMNLSSGFDHRIVDGWDAAEFVQSIKAYLENPATLFI
ncbi:dihydrolipoamide acetyltransferase family protein [Parvularcula marina]|uniref:dihydrolipoamide acetyltransferase family protein n=1 Tax=Parvularcula marina TaxID=2292771 RepID=UPI003512596C